MRLGDPAFSVKLPAKEKHLFTFLQVPFVNVFTKIVL